MTKKRSRRDVPSPAEQLTGYDEILAGISELLDRARRTAAQTINAILTASYWEVGRRIVEFEQHGQVRAAYGDKLWKRLAADLTARHGRGFSKSNIALMRAFYLQWEIFQTASGKFVAQAKGSTFSHLPGDSVSESPFTEVAPISEHRLGSDFAFVGRQTRLRVDDEWFRVDLVFYHRGLRALVLIELKLNKLMPGDIGQMNFYLNYASEHWTRADENPPVGLILCADHGGGVAKYALPGLPNKVLAARYRTALPSEAILVAETDQTRKMLEDHRRT